MSTQKFTIELKAEESNFNEIASSVRGLAAALKDAGPELESIKQTLESLKAVANISANFADLSRSIEKTEDAMLAAERAIRNAGRAADTLDERLNDARITAGSLADALSQVDRVSDRMADSVRDMADTLDDAAQECARTQSQLEELRDDLAAVERQARETDTALSATGDGAKNAGAGASSAGPDMQSLAVAGAAVGVAMAALPAIMGAASGAFNFAKEATLGYLATTRDGQAIIARAQFDITQLKNTIGDSVTNSDLFRDSLDKGVEIVNDLTEVIPPLVNTLDNYYAAAMGAWEATEGLRSVASLAGDAVYYMMNPFAAGNAAIEAMTGVSLDLSDAIDSYGQSLRDTEAALEDQTEAVADLTSVWSDASNAIYSARNATGSFAGQWNRIRESLFGEAEVSVTPVVAGGPAVEAVDTIRDKQLAALAAAKDAQLAAQQAVAAQQELASEKYIASVNARKEAELAAIEATALAREQAAERQAEIQAELDAQRKAELDSYLALASEGYSSLTSTLLSSVEATATASGKASAAVSKGLGEGLTAIGASAKAAGAVKILGDPATGFFPNPGAGIALIGAGIAAEQLGKAMGGKQRGEQRAAPREVQAPVVQAPSNNFYANVNMTGMVGDREGLARMVVNALNTASRSGVLNG